MTKLNSRTNMTKSSSQKRTIPNLVCSKHTLFSRRKDSCDTEGCDFQTFPETNKRSKIGRNGDVESKY